MRMTPLLAALAVLASPAARADTVEASSTTLLTVGQQTRYRGGATPDLVTVAPAYEILSITARDISTSWADDVQVVLSTWGALDLGERRWDAGTSSSLTGDVTTGYVQARMVGRRLTLRLGRSAVTTGVARMIQVDGGNVALAIPAGKLELRVSAYAGVPTSQRFQTRYGLKSWSPTPGTIAYGGRAVVALPIAGAPGRGLELGASTNFVRDHSQAVREEAGGDVRIQPFARTDLALAGSATWSLYDERLAEATGALSVSATRRLHLTADYRFVEPGLLLARNSILSVFTATTWSECGGGLRFDLGRGLSAGADAHLRAEPDADGSGHRNGTDLAGRLDWESGRTSAGLELTYLDAYLNGYTGGRLYARRELGRAFVAGDLSGQAFREKVNGQGGAVTGTLTAGMQLPHGFTAVVAGTAGMNPYLEQTYDVMLKLAYNQTYRTTEVR
jgi:hypothetical protein